MVQQDSSKSHGLTGVNSFGVKEFIRGYSLIDITNTGVLAAYKPDAQSFMDNASQVVKDQLSWNRSRNQQRNWETLMQLISMITQPTVLQQPIQKKNQDLLNYKFSYTGIHTVWEFIIGAEHAQVFDSNIPSGRLIEMCNKIPIVLNLKETFEPNNSIFDTETDVNLYFENSNF